MTPFRTLDAVAMPITQPNFDTDQIIPARFLSRDRDLGLAGCLFHDVKHQPNFPLTIPAYGGAQIVVGAHNFACGSSRENAVWALHDYGFRAAIAPSFGDIFRTNCFKNGVLPVVLPADAVAGLQAQLVASPGAHVQVDLQAQTVMFPDGSLHGFEIDPFAKHCLLNGVDEIAYTMTLEPEIAAFEHRYGRENR